MPKWQKLQKQLKAQKEGSSSKSMKRMMRKMGKQGMNVEEIANVQKVVIYTSDDKIVINQPESVTKMLLPQGEVFQILGASAKEELDADEIKEIGAEETKEPITIEANSEFKPPMADIQMVAQQAGVTPDEAESALVQTKGNLAKAIILLRQK
ncbi:MAG: nascent polypeptide-associated complex protein [Candidatus Helarchaeota archaeon]